MALWFAERFVTVSPAGAATKNAEGVFGVAAWNGEWYARIASHGYDYDAHRPSSVAFFPLYPMLAAGMSQASGLSVSIALPLVSHLFLLGSFVQLAAYLAARSPEGHTESAQWALVAFGLFPTTFYWRLAYSESTLLFFAIVAMYGIERRWHPLLIAGIIGTATGARPQGVALLLPFAMHLWSGLARTNDRSTGRKFVDLCASVAVPLAVACWGLLAYMTYQWWMFGEPLAFVKTQTLWARSGEHLPFLDRAWRLPMLAPLWAVYDPSSPCCWKQQATDGDALFSMMFSNPIYFLFAALLVVHGTRKRWLNAKEFALSAAMLLIPYVTQADRTCMASQARFASVIFPVYFVLGRVLAAMPAPIAAAVCALSAVIMALYSALFVTWHFFN